jgi:hypothetical protein
MWQNKAFYSATSSVKTRVMAEYKTHSIIFCTILLFSLCKNFNKKIIFAVIKISSSHNSLSLIFTSKQ